MNINSSILKPVYLFLICLLSLTTTVTAQVGSTERTSAEVVRNIFKDFLQRDDGTDSHEHQEAMKRSLTSFPDIIDKVNLPLLINVWMYYDPGDFNAKDLIKPILLRNRQISLAAVRQRIKEKKDFESDEKPPFSELFALEKELR